MTGTARRAVHPEARPYDGPRWVQCGRQPREMVDERVSCPLGGVASLDDCLVCHLLETMDQERNPDLSCRPPGG